MRFKPKERTSIKRFSGTCLLKGDSEQKGRLLKGKCPEALAFNLLCEPFKSPLENSTSKTPVLTSPETGGTKMCRWQDGCCINQVMASASPQLQTPSHFSHSLTSELGWARECSGSFWPGEVTRHTWIQVLCLLCSRLFAQAGKCPSEWLAKIPCHGDYEGRKGEHWKTNGKLFLTLATSRMDHLSHAFITEVTIWRTVLKGCRFRKDENHQPKVFF